MKNHTNKLVLAFVMMAMSVHGAHNVNRYIDGGYALYDGEAILQNVSHNHKLDKRLNQSFVEYILEPYEKNKDASKLTELVKSQEIILFSSSKCSIESLKRLKHAFEKLQIKAIVGMNGDDVSFIKPLTNGLINKDKLYILDDNITNLTIPNGLVNTKKLDLSNNESLQTIVLSEGMVKLEEINLTFCPSLQSLTIPAGMTNLQTLDVRSTAISLQDVETLRLRYPGIVLSNFNVPNNQQIDGQEALVQQRASVTKAYEALATNEDTAHLVAANLPSVETTKEKFMTAAADMQAFVTQALAELKLNDGQTFRLKTAIEGLGLLVADGSVKGHMSSIPKLYANYAYPGLPNIRQLFVLAYNLLLEQKTIKQQQKEFVIAYLADADRWNAVKAIFKIDDTLGQELQKPNNVVGALCSFLANGNGLSVPQLQALYKNMPEISNDFAKARLDKFNPLIEALFMIMRGHNNGLENSKEPNNPACAEGAYLNIMKVLGEIKQTKGIMSSISGIKIELCDGSTTSVG